MNEDGFRRELFRLDGIAEVMAILNAGTAEDAQDVLSRLRGGLRHAMEEAGRDALAGFTNHSGGAAGCDIAWDEESSRFGVVSKHWYRGARTPCGNVPMSDTDFLESEGQAKEAARRMNREWSRNARVQNLVRRNWCQAKYADAVYAVGTVQWEAPV
ncbi:MAG: hypothetical protein K6E40_10895, partial [Desulfovibrio sp.]|nr:hypothetical protein [Desulfovibrio sp.]